MMIGSRRLLRNGTKQGLMSQGYRQRTTRRISITWKSSPRMMIKRVMFHTVIYIPEAQEFIIINESPNTVTQTILNHTQNYGLFNASIVRKLWRHYTNNLRTAARRYITDNADERLTSGSGRFKLLLFQETHIPMLFTLTLHSRNRRHWNAAKPSQNRGLF